MALYARILERKTHYEIVRETSLPVGRQVMQVSEERTKKRQEMSNVKTWP